MDHDGKFGEGKRYTYRCADGVQVKLIEMPGEAARVVVANTIASRIVVPEVDLRAFLLAVDKARGVVAQPPNGPVEVQALIKALWAWQDDNERTPLLPSDRMGGDGTTLGELITAAGCSLGDE